MENKDNIQEVKEVIKEVPGKHIIEKETIIEKEVLVPQIKEIIKEVKVDVIKEIQSSLKFENVTSIYKSMALFNQEMENISKNSNNPFFKAAYLDLSAIADTVRPLLAKHGLSVMQYPVQDTEGRIAVNTILTHESGEQMEFPGIFIKPAKMGDVQCLGSTITYMRRYQISSILFVAGKDEDDDGEGAMNRPTPTQTVDKPATSTPKPTVRPAIKGRV